NLPLNLPSYKGTKLLKKRLLLNFIDKLKWYITFRTIFINYLSSLLNPLSPPLSRLPNNLVIGPLGILGSVNLGLGTLSSICFILLPGLSPKSFISRSASALLTNRLYWSLILLKTST